MMWKIRQTREEYEEEFGSPPSKAELADLLGVSQDTLTAVTACSSFPVSIDKPIRYSSGDSSRTLGDIIPDENFPDMDLELDKQKIIEVVRGALSTLNEREEKIMRLRFGIADDDASHKKHPITQNQAIKLVANGGV